MTLVGLLMVRNEEDVIRANLLHHQRVGVERFLVVDNGSGDGTARALREVSRTLPVAWTVTEGDVSQAEVITELAREAHRGGATWVLPIDADEFWHTPGGDLRAVLRDTRAAWLRADVRIFVQRRSQRSRSPDALLHMTRRAPSYRSARGRGEERAAGGSIAYVEIWPLPKVIARAAAGIVIGRGNHGVEGVEGSGEDTDRIVCLHAPLRAREVLDRKAEVGRRREAEGLPPGTSWHLRRWHRLAEEGGLEREWAANSHADGDLDVYGERHPLIVDTRLRQAVAPFVGRGPDPRPGYHGPAKLGAGRRTEPMRGDPAMEHRPGRGEGSPVRIGLWGTFDLENYGDMLFPLVMEAELLRRVPGASIRRFSPVGYAGLNRFDAGRPSEGLGAWSPERVAELADQLDLVVVGGGEIIHTRDEVLGPHYGLPGEELRSRAPSRFFIEGLGPDLEREVPVIWSSVGIPFDPEEPDRFQAAVEGRPYVTVRDETSRERLAGLGVTADVVPDPVLLLPRLWGPDLLERRLRHLRAMGWFPPEGWTVVAQGNRAGVRHAEDLAAALDRIAVGREDPTVMIVATGPCHGDEEFADVLQRHLRTPARRVPAAGLQDIAAAVAASDGFVGSSLHGNITAFAYGRPHVALGWGGETKLAGFAEAVGAPECLAPAPEDAPAAFEKMESLGPRPEVLAALQARSDAHFDRVAELAVEASARGQGTAAAGEAGAEDLRDGSARLREAYRARGRLLATGRWAAADRVARLEREVAALREEVGWLRGRVPELEEELAAKHGELEELRATRTFRYTAGLRGLYGRLRRPGGR